MAQCDHGAAAQTNRPPIAGRRFRHPAVAVGITGHGIILEGGKRDRQGDETLSAQCAAVLHGDPGHGTKLDHRARLDG